MSKVETLLGEVKVLRQIPNTLSISRIGFSFLSFYLVIIGTRWLEAFILLTIALLTDLFDGWLARRFHWESVAGKRLDKIGDTIFFPVVLIAVAITHPFVFWPTIILLISALIGKIIRRDRRTSRKIRFSLHILITGGYVVLSVMAVVVYAYEAFSLSSSPAWHIVVFWLIIIAGCVSALYINLPRVQIWLKDGQKILDEG